MREEVRKLLDDYAFSCYQLGIADGQESFSLAAGRAKGHRAKLEKVLAPTRTSYTVDYNSDGSHIREFDTLAECVDRVEALDQKHAIPLTPTYYRVEEYRVDPEAEGL